jgi:hypothetical protein
MPSWERLAAFEGGTVSWLATARVADGTPHAFVATTVGVFVSTERGLRRSPWGGASRVAGVEVVVTSPSYAEDGIVFAGALGGLYRWRAGGAEWEHLLSGSRVLSAAVAAGGGAELTVLAGTEGDGALISRDSGRTWTGANAGLLDLEVLALAVSPDFERDGLAFAATPTTAYRTRNGAESWREIDVLPDSMVEVGVQSLTVSAAFDQDGVILAGSLDLRALRSDDRGRSWEEVPDLAGCDVFSITSLAGGRAVAATDQGVALSDDGGVSWRLVGTELEGVLSAAVVGDGSQTVLLAGGADRGVFRSEDGGVTWTATNSGLTGTPFVGLLLSPDFERDRTVYAYGLQTALGISEDGGETWTMRDEDLEAEIDVEALPDGTFVLASVPEAAWDKLPPPFPGAEIIAVALSPESKERRDRTAYLATAGRPGTSDPALTLWRTTDRGQRWDRWLELPDTPGGGAAKIVALPANAWGDTVVVGLGDRAHRPRQNAWENRGGARRLVWDATDVPGQHTAGRLPAITHFVVSPAYAQDRTLFAATSAGVYVSRDGGASFAAWNVGVELVSMVAVTLSPAYARDRLVYSLGLGGTIWRREDR